MKNNLICLIRWLISIQILGLIAWSPALRANEYGTLNTPEYLFPQLANIYAVANKKAPALLREIQKISEAEGMSYLFSSDRYPHLNFDINAGYERREREKGEDSDEFRNFFNLSLNQPIYHWGGLVAREQVGEIDIHLAKEEYERFYQNLAQEIRVLYLSLILENISLRNAKLREEIICKNLDVLDEQRRQGVLSEDDYTLQYIQLQETLLEIQRNKNKGQRIVERLEYITGYKEVNLNQLPLEVPSPSLEKNLFGERLNDFINGGYKESPEFSLNAKKIQREKESLKFIESINRPLLNIHLTVQQVQDNTASFNDVDTLIYFGGLRLTWNIFDGFATKGRKIVSMARIRLLEQEELGINNDLSREARKMATDLDLSFRSLELNEARYPFTLKFWDRDNQLWEDNKISELEYLESRLNFFNKQKDLYIARSNFLLNLSEFLSHVGQDPAMEYFTLPQNDERN